MPVAGIDNPVGVAVGADGSLGVADEDAVVRLTDGSSRELPFDTARCA